MLALRIKGGYILPSWSLLVSVLLVRGLTRAVNDVAHLPVLLLAFLIGRLY